ncbi:heterokaryon incompatibility protein-domain-containing protein [Staphylotrichum tortipilum]|uniref:Heterokaryon incompatibility protein-domain-containing protein n=1 Tax=Staphylotrichum tortipilum TaxID=2831512 RepID=A0AAN6MFJ8_9PEZI|nr:heterokaryon incompatibility protein-domain-containing protein [Staphylotrichum longicolle]
MHLPGPKKQFIETTRRTLERHKEGIAIGQLPQTFQDTIQIARTLGVRYVWIDPLCIIQKEKDHADWKRESGRMADVYWNSYLTVAATGADSADGGCFAAPESGVDIGPVKMREIRHFPSTATIGRSAGFPLLTRVWAYQERLLAPWVVQFGRQELIWECREHRTCECGQARYTRKQLHKSDFHDTIYEFSWDKSRTPQQTWRKMVMQCSPLLLTEASDKLPAFSGLADEMQRNSKQDYLAGFWRNTLILDVCWHRPISENNKPFCEAVERAPSWSWASVDRPVEYYDGLYSGSPDHEYGDQQYPKVIAAKCSLAGPSLTSQVSHGSVEFRGCMVLTSGIGNSIDAIGRMFSNFTWHSDERYIIQKQG